MTTSVATDADGTWKALLDGRSGIRKLEDPFVEQYSLPVRIGTTLTVTAPNSPSFFGQAVSFAPMADPNGVANGTHIHFSFLDGDGHPVLYDAQRPWQMSDTGRHFVAGILYHLPALCAVTAPSVASYYRLRPNRWAPVHADIGIADRGAALRVAPLNGADPAQRSRQFNVEFRVCDATANPYLALAAVVQAGLDGIRAQRQIDAGSRRALPASLAQALALLEQTPAATDWLGAELLAGYLLFKRAEYQALESVEESEICRRYAEVY